MGDSQSLGVATLGIVRMVWLLMAAEGSRVLGWVSLGF
jgi:hypothetical protein